MPALEPWGKMPTVTCALLSNTLDAPAPGSARSVLSEGVGHHEFKSDATSALPPCCALLVVDESLLYRNGYGWLRRARSGIPNSEVLVLTRQDAVIGNSTVSEWIDEQIAGSLPLDSSWSDFARARVAILSGELWFSRSSLSAVLRARTDRRLGNRQEFSGPVEHSRLTDREHQIAKALNRGLTNKEIAKELGISQETVKKHLAHVFEKSQTKNRSQLIAHLSLADRQRE